MARRVKTGRSDAGRRNASSANRSAANDTPPSRGATPADAARVLDHHANTGPASSNAASANPASAGALRKLSWQSFLAGGALVTLFIWSYWPILQNLVHAWETEPDYSHGYMVAPIACYFLWARRESLPAADVRFAWGGLLLLIFSVAVRLAGGLLYIDAVEAWSLPFWIAGSCWFLAGRKRFVWALPAIVFLGFMIPLPYRAEHLLSYPLQRIATQLSCWMLQTLGQPAIREGNIVLINDLQLNIVEACSGLRIFVSVIALAFAYLVLVDRPWWTKCFLVIAILPVSLLANASRIALTGLLHVYVSGEAAHKFSHDFAGWLMLPLAAAALAAVIWYADRLIIKFETLSPRDVLLAGERSVSS